MQALQDTYDDDGKLISGVLYDDDGNLISPKIGDEVGVPEKLKEFDTQPFKANLSFFEPKKPQVQPDIKPPSGDSSLDLSEEDKKLAQQTVPYKGGIVSALWLKNHPDGIYGIGRNDERLTNVPELIEHGTQRLIDKSTMSDVIPEWIKPGIARSLSVLGYSVETVANILNDPTAPVMGVIGSLKKALANAALTQAAKDKLIADAAKEIKLLGPAPDHIANPPRFLAGEHGIVENVPYRIENGQIVPPQIPANYGQTVGIGSPGSTGSTVNLAELAEQARIRALTFGAAEQTPGGSLTVPNARLPIPPVSGDTRLGFNPQSEGVLPYPLNVVPNMVRPRSVQTAIANESQMPILDRLYDPEAIGAQGELPVQSVLPEETERLTESIFGPVRTTEKLTEPATPKVTGEKLRGPGGKFVKSSIQPGTYGSHHITDPKVLGIIDNAIEQIQSNLGKKVVENEPGYVSEILENTPSGTPGLSVRDMNPTITDKGKFRNLWEIAYRGPDGTPIAVARVMKNPDGTSLVRDLVVDKSKGLLHGRASKSVLDELYKMGALESETTLSPDAIRLISRAEERFPSNVSSIVPEERLPQTGMFGQRVGETPVEPNQGIISRFFEDDSSVAGSSGRPKRGYKIDVNTLNNPIAKIIVKLRQARPLTKEQAEIYRLERGRRVGNIDNLGEMSGEDWLNQAKSALAGKYSKVRFDPLDLSDDEFTSLINDIRGSDLNTFEKTRAAIAIEKIMRGQVPQRNEIRTLSSIFTKKLTRDLGDINAAQDVTAQLVNELYRKKPMLSRTAGGMQDIQRTLMSSMDMSAPFRQGITGIYNKEWWTSWDDMFKAWGSEKASLAIDDSIKAMPEYGLMKNRLSLTDVTPGGIAEEGFGSHFAEKFVPFVRRSERAYAAFLNKFRADLFAKMMKDGKNSGMPTELLADFVADHINAITGRASLGKLEKHLDALNTVFYAPRLMASRVKMLEMLTPVYYINQPAVVRKQALKAVLSMASVVGTVNILGKMAGGTTEYDPRSSDSYKVKFGNTRIDPGGGELQYLTALARLLSQSTKTQAGKIIPFGNSPVYDDSTYDILKRFLENKGAPDAALTLKGAKGYDPEGKKFNMPIEVAKTFTPMILQDLADILQNDDDLMPEMPKDPRALAAAPLTFFGMGSQTYK